MPKKHYLLIILLMPLLLWAEDNGKSRISSPGSALRGKAESNKLANDCERFNNWQLERLID